MKKILSTLIILVLLFSNTFAAYNATQKDRILLNKIYTKIDKLLWSSSVKADKIASKISSLKNNYDSESRVYYIFDSLESYINNKIKNNENEDDFVNSVLNEVSNTNNSNNNNNSNSTNNSCERLALPTTNTITVSNITQLNNAVTRANATGWNLNILLEDWTYNLSRILYITADNVSFQSVSWNREDVILRWRGMSWWIPHVFLVRWSNFTVADLTLWWIANHAIQIQWEQDADNALIHNVHIVDTWEQMIKWSYNKANDVYANNWIVECSLLEYSAGIWPQYYIWWIDVHRGVDWIVRDNIFKGIRSPESRVAEHAVHFWSNSENTLVERNTIINCDRWVGFGLWSSPHSGWIIRDNIIYHDTTSWDVGIWLENVSWVLVDNNIIFGEHSYANAIEYRFAGTSADIRNNITNKQIRQRNWGNATLSNNITNATRDMFVDVSNFDFTLVDGNADDSEDETDSDEEEDNETEEDSWNDNNWWNIIGEKNGSYTTSWNKSHLIYPRDLVYKWAFRLPGKWWDYGWWADYGGGWMTFYPDWDSSWNDSYPGSIYAFWHPHQLELSEISIPTPVISSDKNLDDLNTASTLQAFTNTRNFEIPAPWTTSHWSVQYNKDDNKLYTLYGRYYQFAWWFASVANHNLDLQIPNTKWPYIIWDGHNPHNMSIWAYTFEIPESFANTYTNGATLVTWRYSTRSYGWGPSLHSFIPNDSWNPLESTKLMQYTNSNHINNYTWVDRRLWWAWLTSENKSAVMLSSTKSVWDTWYWFSDWTRWSDCTQQWWEKECSYSSVWQRGWHADGYDWVLMFFDPNHLAAISEWKRSSHNIQPYAVLNIDDLLYHIDGSGFYTSARMWAVSYDRENWLIYIMEKFWDSDPDAYRRKPLVHVFKLEVQETTDEEIDDEEEEVEENDNSDNENENEEEENNEWNDDNQGTEDPNNDQNDSEDDTNDWQDSQEDNSNDEQTNENDLSWYNFSEISSYKLSLLHKEWKTQYITKEQFEQIDMSANSIFAKYFTYEQFSWVTQQQLNDMVINNYHYLTCENVKKIPAENFENMGTRNLWLMQKAWTEKNLNHCITKEQIQAINMVKNTIYGKYFTSEQFANVTQLQINTLVPNNYPYLSLEGVSKIPESGLDNITWWTLSQMEKAGNIWWFTQDQIDILMSRWNSGIDKYFD